MFAWGLVFGLSLTLLVIRGALHAQESTRLNAIKRALRRLNPRRDGREIVFDVGSTSTRQTEKLADSENIDAIEEIADTVGVRIAPLD